MIRTQDFQREIARRLQFFYKPMRAPIKCEWRAFEPALGLYSPRIDVAVGPFSITRGENRIEEYDQLMKYSKTLIEACIDLHRDNVNRYRHSNDPRVDSALVLPKFETIKRHNSHARCFLAIEVENRVSRKHLLGGVVNSAALGRVAIVVGWNEEKIRSLVRLQAYWDFLRVVGKTTFNTKNVLILSPEQSYQALANIGV